MARLNRLTIIGHLGADPELRYTPSGKAVCNLRVAVNTGRKGPDGEWIDSTMWVNVETWDQAAERAAETFAKGNQVYAEGDLHVRDYQDRDGKDRYSIELRFARVQSLERKPRDEDAGGGYGYDRPPARQAAAVGAGAQTADALDVDDIPF